MVFTDMKLCGAIYMLLERKSVVLMFVPLKDVKLACSFVFFLLLVEHTSSLTLTPDLLELTMPTRT
jgi:hypothetical protein